MILFPAIDLKDGACVRLFKGDMEQATVFNHDPANQARAFAAQGFEYLHIVDLNGAIAGKPVNSDAVESIIQTAHMPVQLGGGIRTLGMIDHWLERGVSRVILGTVALTEPEMVIAACKKFPGKIAVGIDARNGFVAVDGWVRTSEVTAMELGLRFQDAGVAAIIHTDIDRDGALQGPNIDASAELAEGLSIPVIVSGGISSITDIKNVAARSGTGIIGAISGRAIYDGKFDVSEALRIMRNA